jgi:hypothetical protein
VALRAALAQPLAALAAPRHRRRRGKKTRVTVVCATKIVGFEFAAVNLVRWSGGFGVGFIGERIWEGRARGDGKFCVGVWAGVERGGFSVDGVVGRCVRDVGSRLEGGMGFAAVAADR